MSIQFSGLFHRKQHAAKPNKTAPNAIRRGLVLSLPAFITAGIRLTTGDVFAQTASKTAATPTPRVNNLQGKGLKAQNLELIRLGISYDELSGSTEINRSGRPIAVSIFRDGALAPNSTGEEKGSFKLVRYEVESQRVIDVTSLPISTDKGASSSAQFTFYFYNPYLYNPYVFNPYGAPQQQPQQQKPKKPDALRQLYGIQTQGSKLYLFDPVDPEEKSTAKQKPLYKLEQLANGFMLFAYDETNAQGQDVYTELGFIYLDGDLRQGDRKTVVKSKDYAPSLDAVLQATGKQPSKATPSTVIAKPKQP